MKQLRVKLDPLPAPEPGQRLGVEGAKVSLLTRGGGSSAVTIDSNVAAELVFGATLLSKAQGGESAVRENLKTLTGSLLLPAGGPPRFELDAGADAPEPAPVTGVGPRRLLLELESATFGLNAASTPVLLKLPNDLEGFEHLELEAELKLAGAPEATGAKNDVLDVPLRPRPLFSLRLTDQVGEPLAGVQLEFEWAGKTEVITTDGDGFAGVDRLGAGAAQVRFADLAALKERLKTLWATAKAGAIVREVPGVVVLDAAQLDEPSLLLTEQRQLVSLQPRVVQARLFGLLFETNKNFLLPEAIGSLKRIKELYDTHPNSKLLIVGHTDTAGSTSTNDSLSLERAESMAAYLKDDVAAWEARYTSAVSETRRWGAREDLLMLSALNTPGAAVGVLGEELVSNFQTAHNNLPESRRSPSFETLSTDGQLDASTRRQLIADYMHQDDTTLPDDVEIVTHGCSEHFPLSDAGDRVDATAADGQDDPLDRRVELFFFDKEFGILPNPPGKNSKAGATEYPEWRRRARATEDLEADGHGPLVIGTANFEVGELALHISEPDAEAPLAILKKEHAVDEDQNLAFSVVAETLPKAVRFALLVNDNIEYQSTTVNPLELRNALFVGDLGKASGQLTKADTPEQSARLAKAGPTVGKDKEALRVLVQWQHTHPNSNEVNRFLKDMKVTLKDADSGSALAEATRSKKGSLIFDVPDSVQQLRFECSIKARSTGKQVLTIDETFKVTRGPSSQTGMVPTSTLNARIRRFEFVPGPRKVSVVLLDLDLTFLDVTEHVKALPDNAGKRSGRLGTVTGLRSKVVVLEHTQGRPTTWPVLLPVALDPKTDETNVLLFLKNEAVDSVDSRGAVVPGTHTNSDDANYARALGGYFESPGRTAKYVDSGTQADPYENYPPFGWDKQLANSKKPVVNLFPIPHGEPFGVLERPNRGSKALIESALRALFAEKRLASAQRLAPTLRRLAVGGWSSGVNALFRWGATRKDLDFVDELYVFDGLSAAQGIPIDAANWLQLKPDRRLRVIGTAYTEVAANQIQKQLRLKTVPNPNVFVHPGDPEYWYTNADYHRTLQRVGDTQPPTFRSQGASPTPGDPTSKTKIFFDREFRALSADGTSVAAKLTLASEFGTRAVIKETAHQEAAALAMLDQLIHQRRIPVDSADDFTFVTGRLEGIKDLKEPKTSHRHRHAWSVFGGLFNDKPPTFVGYLQLCLEKSGF